MSWWKRKAETKLLRKLKATEETSLASKESRKRNDTIPARTTKWKGEVVPTASTRVLWLLAYKLSGDCDQILIRTTKLQCQGKMS